MKKLIIGLVANGILIPLTIGLFRLVFRGLRITGAPSQEVFVSWMVLLVYFCVLFYIIWGLMGTLRIIAVSVTVLNCSLLLITGVVFVMEWSATSSMLVSVGPLSIQKVVWSYYELRPILEGLLCSENLSDLSNSEKFQLMNGYPTPEELACRVKAKRIEVDAAVAAAAAALAAGESWSGWLTKVMNSPVTQGVLVAGGVLWPVFLSCVVIYRFSYAIPPYVDYAISHNRVMNTTVDTVNAVVAQHNGFMQTAEQYNDLYQAAGANFGRQIASHAGQIIMMTAEIDNLRTQFTGLSTVVTNNQVQIGVLLSKSN